VVFGSFCAVLPVLELSELTDTGRIESCYYSRLASATKLRNIESMIVVILMTDLARELHEHSFHSEASDELVQCLDRIGARLEPIHPGSNDTNLVKYFSVELPLDAVVAEFLGALRSCRGVEAAYFKPSDESP
jgi:hypothetical protein